MVSSAGIHLWHNNQKLVLFSVLLVIFSYQCKENYSGSEIHIYPAETKTHHPQSNPNKPVEVFSAVLHDVSFTSLEEGNTSPDYFRDILKMIRLSKKQTVFPSEIVTRLQQGFPVADEESILITFDDGWVGIKDYAHPLLLEFEMKAAAFVQTADINFNSTSRCCWKDLQEMATSGLWEIHSHSATHQDMTTLSGLQLKHEMETSFHDLRNHGFQHSLYIAYPFGSHSPLVHQASLDAGYQAGFAALPKVKITNQDDLFALPRSTICQLFDQKMVCNKLGLNMEIIRKEIAIFDETEGNWTGEWRHIFFKDHAKPGFTNGQFGYRYAVSTTAQASWSIQYQIDKPGYYSIHSWFPADGVLTNQQHIWKCKPVTGKFQYSGTVKADTKNGWTPLNTIWLKSGLYEFILESSSLEPLPFIVDALKIERINP